MTTVQTQIPDQLLQQAQYLVQQGWVANIDDLIAESMRRYLESHRESMTERFICEDVDWGCMGKTEPIVIADAGPVIHLDELGCLYLLADFGFTYSPCLAGRGDYQRRS